MNAVVCTPGPVLMLEPAAVVHTTLAWVPTTAGLPDALEAVLCWVEAVGDWYAGYWDGAHWVSSETEGHLLAVTHWARVEGPV